MRWVQWLSIDAIAICISALSAASVLGPAQVAFPAIQPAADSRVGAVASENTICSQIGVDLLRNGGNAADALVGTMLCVGVIGMYHSGIGGGGFMLVRASNGSYEVIDFRETAPAAAYEDMFKNNIAGSIYGGLASGVPGEIRGLEYLHQNYGVLPWAVVMQPAIKLARYGFTVSHDLLLYMDSSTASYDFLTLDPTWAIDFAPNGTRVGLGDTLTRKRYADTLEIISKEGADAFYTGAMANFTVQTIQRLNGSMTMQDLAEYSVASRVPVEIEYRDFRVIGCGSPASGAVALSTLKTVEGYDGFRDAKMLNLSTHRLDEAIRFAYGERTELGDPDFVEGIGEYEARMLSETSAAAKRHRISDKHTLNISDYDPAGFESPETHGTSHIVTADASGMAITLTSTINLIFGSHVMVPETGVILNNQMNDFSIPKISNAFGYVPSPSNYIRPRKRPLSSVTPTIVEHLSNRSLYYIVGSAGGSRIITATVQNIWHVLDHNMSAIGALEEPRFHDQLIPNVVGFEWGMNKRNGGDKETHGDDFHLSDESGIGTGEVKGFDNRTVAFMKAKGHNVTWVPPGYSSAQSIRWLSNGTFEAAGEPRQQESGGFAV